MIIAQITDLHMRRDDTPVSGAVVTRPYVAAAVDAVRDHQPDAVVVTGDLTDIGTAEEYALVRAELDRFEIPVFVIPGNHDRCDALRIAFSNHSYLPAEGPINWVVDDFPVRLIGLDSVVAGKSHGLAAPKTLDFLDAALAASDRPTIVAIHHPPFPTGIPAMDRIGCLNGDELAAIIARHSHVERVICGHQHRPVQLRWAGTHGMIAPSIAHQVALDFAPAERASWVLEPPAFFLHRWSAATGLVSHQAYVGAFEGPHPFALDPEYPGAT